MATFCLALLFSSFLISSRAHAASTPTLTLTNNTSTIGIHVTGADPNATVLFYFPNQTANSTGVASFTSIDIGEADASGSFNVSVAPNSFGLGSGSSVYVSADGANSSQASWPSAANTSSGTNGGLSLSQNSVTIVVGQSANIFPNNTANILTLNGNSGQSIASAYYQSTTNSVTITGLAVGSSNISICAGSTGCGTVSVTVQAPTQTVTFSQSPAYVVLGQPATSVNIYGPGSGYSISNPYSSLLTTSLNGTSILLQGLTLGQATISVCADSWKCGSLVVNVVNNTANIPTQTNIPQPISSDFSKPPQLTSLSFASNDVLGRFFGAGSNINLNFGTNQTVTNMVVKIAGQQVNATQSNNGLYYASYQMTGTDVLPLPVSISFSNPTGLTGSMYTWLGDSATLPAGASSASSANSTTASPPSGTSASNSSGNASANSSTYTFSRYLYMSMTASGVSDPDVVALQRRLQTDGVYSGPITGYFGPLTKTAVDAYQKKNGLVPAGIVGPSTRALLNKGI